MYDGAKMMWKRIKFIDARGNPTLDSLRLCELYSTGIVVLDYEMFKTMH